MTSRNQEWTRVLADLGRGDRLAYLRVSNLVMGLISKQRLFDLQAHWDDICQEVMLQLIKSVRADAIRDADSFVSYCATVTRRESYRWIRQTRRQRERTADLEPEDSAASLDRTDAPDLRVQMARALDDLSEKRRQVMDAIYLRGYTYEEAAEQLGMPLGTLKRAQTQALRELREKLGGEE